MATSTLRAVILVAAVIIGVIVIRNAFPQNASQGISTPGPAKSTHAASPTPTVTASLSPSRKPRVKGVTVQVLNGTHTTGLAGIVTIQLKKAGYTSGPPDPGNTQTATRTTIFYKAGFQPEAQFLQQKHFPKAVVAPAPSNFSADLTVVLGLDFSASSS